MADIDRQLKVNRRRFLQTAATGLLLSVVGKQGADGSPAQDVDFTSDQFSFALEVPRGGAARLRSLRNAKTGFEWAQTNTPIDPVFKAAGDLYAGWVIGEKSKQEAVANRFEHISRSKDERIRARTRLQAFRDAPVLEVQTEFLNTASTPLAGVNEFGPFRFALRNDLGNLQVHGVRRDAYGLKVVPVTGSVAFAGGRWNSPEYGGLLLLEAVDRAEFLLLGIEWERGWAVRIDKEADGTWLSVRVMDLIHDMAPKETLSAPRIFLGVAHGNSEDAFRTARHYMQSHVFPERPKNWPWVVYDLWSTDAEGVEEALLKEIDFAATLGVDVLVHDASWYAGSEKKGTGDWGCGLGNYTEDRQKFPNGLIAISNRAKEKRMKFGLWVGPNAVDSRIVGTVIPAKWIAWSEGKVRSLQPDGWESPVQQVCLGCREYIDFLKANLTRIVSEYRLDWLKWDNSGLPGIPALCDRNDHGHQAGDGSFASLVGQYEIFDHLHATFPDLVLEQCGYGSRLDYGIARTIRSNWLSDASYPSSHVRQNALFASYLYPSSDNGAWIVIEDEDLLKNLNNPAELDTIFRSRMMNQFGFGTILGYLRERISLFPEPILSAARRNVAVYKRFRHLLQADCYHLLPVIPAENKFQAVQFVNSSAGESVVLAFKAGSSLQTMQVPLHGLERNRSYEVTYANGDSPARMSGADLLSKGIALSLRSPATSEVVLLRQESRHS
jgi:alpha-galactosidase